MGELLRSRLHLVEQPHVLDRDHRLVGEGLDQLDLLVGERLRHRSCHDDHADEISLPQQRHAERCSVAADLLRVKAGVFRVGKDIGT